MSPVDFKKRPCRPVDFKGQWPLSRELIQRVEIKDYGRVITVYCSFPVDSLSKPPPLPPSPPPITHKVGKLPPCIAEIDLYTFTHCYLSYGFKPNRAHEFYTGWQHFPGRRCHQHRGDTRYFSRVRNRVATSSVGSLGVGGLSFDGTSQNKEKSNVAYKLLPLLIEVPGPVSY